MASSAISETSSVTWISAAPTVICQNITVQLNESGYASITPEQLDGGSTDDNTLAEDLLFSASATEFYCNNIGTNTVILTVTDIDGNIYTTVKIGEQWWMSQNLKTSHYADGKEIPFVQDNELWDELNLTDNAYCTYFDGNGYTGVDSVLYNL